MSKNKGELLRLSGEKMTRITEDVYKKFVRENFKAHGEDLMSVKTFQYLIQNDFGMDERTVTKHFARMLDRGYIRIEARGTIPYVKTLLKGAKA